MNLRKDHYRWYVPPGRRRQKPKLGDSGLRFKLERNPGVEGVPDPRRASAAKGVPILLREEKRQA